jgi:two-component system cell cycle response regulator DivK
MPGAPILVVDDAPVSLKLMRLLLTHEGYEVRTAERAEDALQMLSTYRPDLVLADIQLPGMSGLDMTRRIKADPRTSDIRVVALTACAMKEDKDNAMRAGCEDFISKPVDTASLAARVRNLLARRPPAPAPLPPAPDISFSSAEVEFLGRRFLTDGAARCLAALDSLGSKFDAASFAGQLHQWKGTAGMLGHGEIFKLARYAEEVLGEEPVDLSRLRDALTDLYQSFEDLRDNKTVPVPESVLQALGGRRIAMVGFAPHHADALCSILERVKARPRLFGQNDNPESESIRECDLVIVHVRTETMDSPLLAPGLATLPGIRLVLTGERRDLFALSPDVRARAAEVLVHLTDADEVLMRLAMATTRGSVQPPPAQPEANGGASAKTRSSMTRPSVVLADDDAIVLKLVGSTLQNYGMTCRSADNGLDALRLIRSEEPQVAVLDVNMPGMDGFSVLSAIRAEKLPSRVILVTALQQEREVLRAFELGADDYLTKPFNPFELVARLKRLLR